SRAGSEPRHGGCLGRSLHTAESGLPERHLQVELRQVRGNSMFEDFLQRSAGAYRRPWPILVAAAIVTAVLAGGIPRLTVDNDIKSMLPKTDRTRALTELYDGESNFGSSNAVFVGVEAADVYSLDTLRYIKKLQDEISDLDRSLPVRQMARLLRLSPEES